MKLYGEPPARSVRPIWMLNEFDLACEIVPVDVLGGGLRTPEFLAVNPFGKIPALVDGDVRIAESVAIMFHLAEVHGGGRFLPVDPALRAQMFQWNFFLVTEIEQPLWRASLHSVIYPEAERNPAARPARRPAHASADRGPSERSGLDRRRRTDADRLQRRLYARLGRHGARARRVAELPPLCRTPV